MILLIYVPGDAVRPGGTWNTTLRILNTVRDIEDVVLLIDNVTMKNINEQSFKEKNVRVVEYSRSFLKSKLTQLFVIANIVKSLFSARRIVISAATNSSFNFIFGNRVFRIVHSEVNSRYGFSFFERFSKKKYIAVSQYIKEKLIQSGVNERSVSILYNIPDTDITKHAKRTDNNKEVKIITAGHFVKYRRIDLWLEIAEELTKRYANVEFHWYGADSDFYPINGNKRVKVHKFSHSMRDIMINSHVYLNITEFETFGLSVLEAMSCALPIIASKRGNLTYLVAEGKNGYLAENNKADFVSKLKILIESRSQLKEVSYGSYRIFEALSEKYDFERQLRAIIE
jgi:glycosyltransferase involved in cell wall biosynthesis